jgi:hypothetical protein
MQTNRTNEIGSINENLIHLNKAANWSSNLDHFLPSIERLKMTHVHILSLDDNKKSLLVSNVASNRLRLSYIFEAAKTNGIYSTKGLFIPSSAKIVFVGKITVSLGEVIIEHFLKELNACKTTIIIDYTDDWLSQKGHPNCHLYQKLIQIASAVVVPNKGLSKKIIELKKKCYVVPDGLDNIGPFPPKEKNNEVNEVLWFGHSSNLTSLTNYLDGEFGQKNFRLNILTTDPGLKYFNNFNFKNNPGFKASLFPWSFDNLKNVAKRCDFKLLPTNKPFASANRLLTSFNLGLPVITSSIECYEPFSNFYAEIGTSQVNQLINNPSKWNKKVTNAQTKVQKLFKKEKIVQKWNNVFIQYMN